MMGYEEKRVRMLLKEHKAVLVRQNKHEMWKLANGGGLVLPSTPSDYRAWKNALSFLHNALDLNASDRGTPGERRERRTTLFTRPTPVTPLEAPKLPSMASQMCPVAQSSRAIKHPVHGSPAPAQEITVDLSGLLAKFGGSK